MLEGISAPLPIAMLTLAASVVSACSETKMTTPVINYPLTKRVDVVEIHFAHTIFDPSRWLDNDVHSDKQVAAWVESQNKATNAYLASLRGRAVFKERLKQLFNCERLAIPIKKTGRYFYFRNSGADNQRTLYVRDGVDDPGRMLIDPNSWAKDGVTALAEWSASDDGASVAYAVQDGGMDWRTIKVLDVNTGKVLGDELKWARFTSFVWATDGAGGEGMPQKSKMATFAKNALCRRARNAGLNWRFTITTTVSKGVKQRHATIHHLPGRSSGSAV